MILSNEVSAKLIHYLFGILTTVVLYKTARLYLSPTWSLLCCLIFYSSLVVSWLSITAYSDLVRAFYESFSFYYLAPFLKRQRLKLLIISAVLLGFAICVKLISLGSLGVFVILLLLLSNKKLNKITILTIFITVSITVALPWFIISLYHTGNPI